MFLLVVSGSTYTSNEGSEIDRFSVFFCKYLLNATFEELGSCAWRGEVANPQDDGAGSFRCAYREAAARMARGF